MNSATNKTRLGLFVGALALGALLSACNGGSTNPTDNCPEPGKCNPMSQLLDTGAVVFQSCAGCHGFDGRGYAGAKPPLANSDFFMNPANRAKVIDIVLNGYYDSLYVNGMWYKGDMPEHTYLSDLAIAGVLTYIRTQLNDSTVVSCTDYNPADTTTFDPIDGFAICQKTPRDPAVQALDSVAAWEVKRVRDTTEVRIP